MGERGGRSWEDPRRRSHAQLSRAAAQSASAVIRRKQARLSQPPRRPESSNPGMNFNIRCVRVYVRVSSQADRHPVVNFLFLLLLSDLVCSDPHLPLRFPTMAEPSGGSLQGPQARPQAQSHGVPEEQAAARRRGGRTRPGEGEREGEGPRRQQQQQQDVAIDRGRPPAGGAHGHELSRGNK